MENSNYWEEGDVDIAGLITMLGSNDWVDRGREFLQDNDTCPFCQQKTITESFRQQLEKYFDENFKDKKQELLIKKSQYESFFSSIFKALLNIESLEKQNSNSKLDLSLFSIHLKALHSQYAENIEHIKAKLENSSNIVKLTSTRNECLAIKDCIDIANQAIDEHNKIIRNIKEEHRNLKNDIWKFVANESKNSYELYRKKSDGLSKGIKALSELISTNQTKIRKLDDEIKNLNKNITGVQSTVDEINRLLIRFGFNNFQLVPSPDIENYYAIQREDGSLAHSTLSEGEITFITFLYFLQLVKGSHSGETVSNDRIVVIDDPISSLDSNVLFIVSTLIKGLIRDIEGNINNTKQLILFTHNIYFHKEVSFIDGRTQEKKEINFWIIRKINKISKIQAYGMKNPIESSYELLWREIKNRNLSSGITIQNTMRRIIENYFKILGKYGNDDLIDKFETQEDRDICKSLLCWINDGSHCLYDDLFIQSPDDCIERYFCVFERIFEHTDNIGHYNMMMREPHKESSRVNAL
ncbi:MAG: AAA family ATPase [Proteobacteria bacterium]|nr:AAA family ATPase [Pseudomonadota bacterium]